VTQASLFGPTQAGEGQQVCRFRPGFEAWQPAARRLLAQGIAPQDVWWQPDSQAPVDVDAHAPPAPRVPRVFLDMARAASCHSQPDRWALLYSLLWRLTHGERHLMQLGGDAQIVRLTAYVKAVRRDVHKMKAFVRFRAVTENDGQTRYVAWFEPAHFIVEYAAGFFSRRFSNMRWSILTPLGCAHWEGADAGGLWFSAPVDRGAAPDGDALEDAWQVYYRSIFNPARVKVRAMQSEMPRKYWKNLPEARLIPQLLREADRRVSTMQARPASEERLHCGPRPDSPGETLARATASAGDALSALALRAQACRGCPLWEPATQTVFGEGPARARIMLVGEQPGDQEDLAGRPFVGPAGELLDRALAAAGLDRGQLYVTNAVKHFKFEPRGKRRIHAKPSARDIAACRPWVEAELRAVDPAIVVCLGLSAGLAMLDRPLTLNRSRGQWIEQDARQYLLTAHPAYLLRLPDRRRRQVEYDRFVSELALAAQAA
jgi:DNA polymerase